MKDKKKLIVVVLALVVVGAAYKFVFAGTSDANARIHGQVYVLPKEFLINLADGRFAKVTVALVLPSGEKIEPEKGTQPPEGFGPLPQEGAVRAVVTDVMTDASADDLIDKAGRARVRRRVLRSVRHDTDVKATKVLFTDVAVQ
jgi:flagellar basal body-associated protein FliL